MKLGLLSKMLLSILTPAIAGLLLVAGVSYKMSEEMLLEQIINDARALCVAKPSACKPCSR